MAKHELTLQQIIEELQGLSRKRMAAEVVLFMRCHEFETKDANVWKESGLSFDGLLKKYDICEPPRYRNFLVARSVLKDDEVIEKIGPNATIEAGGIMNAARRSKYIEAASTRRDETGMPWSRQQAEAERVQIAGSEPRDSAWNKRRERLDTLEEKNKKLTEELRAAQRTIKLKDEEIAKLKAVIGKALKPTPKSPGGPLLA